VSQSTSGWPIEQVVEILEKVDLFAGLSREDLEEMAGIVGGTTAKAGEAVFEEGDTGDAFYIVFQGAVELVKARPDDTEERLAIRRNGEGFGEMSLLNAAPRSATARCVEESQLIIVPRDAFRELLGGDSLALRMMTMLAQALRAMDVRLTHAGLSAAVPVDDATAGDDDDGADAMEQLLTGANDPNRISRAMQATFLPTEAPEVEGYDLAGGTTVEERGRGGSTWDFVRLPDGRWAFLTLDVREDGHPPAFPIGVARAVFRAMLRTNPETPEELLRNTNEALTEVTTEGMDQFVEVGVLILDGEKLHWASAGRVPGGVIRRDGTFEEFGSHGPPLGMMGGFNFAFQEFTLSEGDSVLVLSHGSQGLFMGAADLVAQFHGKPADEIVQTLHKAIRKAQGESHTEASVIYARRL